MSTSFTILLVLALFMPGCGTGESPEAEEPAEQVEQPKDRAVKAAAQERGTDHTMDPQSIKGRSRDGAALAVAEELKPELAAALPPTFPDDIPLGNWLSISSVRQLGETDFVLGCFTSYRRAAVGEFFVHQMPEQGWKLVSRSSKPILSVFTFRKDQRAVTVMVKKQVMNGDVAFDLSYKAN